MSSAFSFEVKGLAELRANMLALPKKFDRRILQAALLVGARQIANEAKAEAPVLKTEYRQDKRRKPGTLRRNIRARAIRPQPGMTASVVVGVRRLSRAAIAQFKASTKGKGASNPDDPYYAQWVEFKTRRANLRPQPFLRPAFARRKDMALQAFRQKISERIASATAGMKK